MKRWRNKALAFFSMDDLNWQHWLVVSSSLLLTIGAWYITSQQSMQRAQQQFDYEAEKTIQFVQERIEKYKEALRSGLAMLHAAPERVNRKQWKVFSKSLNVEKRFPGIHGIGVIHWQSTASIGAYLNWQRELMPDFYVHPVHEHEDFWPVSYIEPQQFNARTIGLDIAHEPNRHNAAIKSRDTGTAQITAPITLIQDETQTPGFLFYVPWYQSGTLPDSVDSRRKLFLGLLYAPFIMNELMSDNLENIKRQVNFSIHDSGITLYSNVDIHSENHDTSPWFERQSTVSMYGRQWIFSIQSSMLFREYNVHYGSVIILFCGLIIDSLLLFLFIVLSRSRKKAKHYAEHVTNDLKIQKSELEMTHGRLACAMDAMMDVLIVIDKEGIIIETNRATESLFGYKKSELVGNNVKMLMPEPDQSKHDSYIKGSSDNIRSVILGQERELLALHADGHTFPIKLSTTKGDYKGERFFTGVIHDLSDLAESQREQEKVEGLLKAAVENAESFYIICDKSGIILDANPALCQWLGYSKSELKGTYVLGLVVDEFHHSFQTDLDKLRTALQVSCSEEMRYRDKNNSIKWGMATTTAVRNKSGVTEFIVTHIVSLDRQKNLEYDLGKRNESLALANRELNQFAYIASHDLKEPLRTLRTFTGYLVKDYGDAKWDRVKQDIYHIENAAERMSNLITALLELSSAGNNELKLSAVSSQHLAKSLVLDMKIQLEESKVQMNIVSDDVYFEADRELLSKAIRNLVSNAIKFKKTDEMSKIDVIIKRSEKKYMGVIEVIDNGIGIEEGKLDQIFLAFKRLHGFSEYEGTGIGLAIVKKVIDRHKGKVKVVSIPGEGSRFSLFLPLMASNNVTAIEQENKAVYEY